MGAWKYIVTCIIVSTTSNSVAGSDLVKIGILHLGDLFSQLAPIQDSPLEPCKGTSKRCVGGAPALAAHANNIEATYFADVETKLRLATGNILGGHASHLSVLRSSELTSIPNLWLKTWLRLDYLSLGIEEFHFDSTLESYSEYLRHYDECMRYPPSTPGSGFLKKTTIVLSNSQCDLNSDRERTWRSARSYRCLELKKIKIGIFGFIDPIVNDMANTGDCSIEDPAEAIQKLIQDKDADIFVAIGTGNYSIAKSIIDRSSKVNIVIYGGERSPVENNNDYLRPYKDSFIASTGAFYGAKVGALKLSYNITAQKLEVEGIVTQTDLTIPLDPSIVRTVQDIQIESGQQLTSRSVVPLSGVTCGSSECNSGSLVADALVHCAYNNLQFKRAPIHAVWHSGGISKIVMNATDKLKVLDAMSLLSHNFRAVLLEMKGATLRKMLERSSEALRNELRDMGQFLQVSRGLRVTYKDGRLASVMSLQYNQDGNTLSWQEIKKFDKYYIVIPSLLFEGKLGFNFIPPIYRHDYEATYGRTRTISSAKCLRDYLDSVKTISIGPENRIVHIQSDDSHSTYPCIDTLIITFVATTAFCCLVGISILLVWSLVSKRRLRPDRYMHMGEKIVKTF